MIDLTKRKLIINAPPMLFTLGIGAKAYAMSPPKCRLTFGENSCKKGKGKGGRGKGSVSASIKSSISLRKGKY